MKRVYEKKDGAIVLVEAVLGYTQYIHGKTKGYLPDIKKSNYYTPCIISIL